MSDDNLPWTIRGCNDADHKHRPELICWVVRDTSGARVSDKRIMAHIAALRAQVAGLASLLARIADRSSSRSESLERLVDEAAATVKALAEAGG